MTVPRTSFPTLHGRDEAHTPVQIAESVLSRQSPLTELDTVFSWFAELRERSFTEVERVPLAAMTGWRTDQETGNIGHRSGKFYTVQGLDVRVPDGPVPHWNQPIIDQPEVGILGILVKEFHGVLHCLMQAKVEPGNCNGLQLSPTVQATRSNYTGVHNGRSVPYLEYFRDQGRHHVLADVRQSEQGSWFYQKRNRNMVVEVFEDVELLDGFCWLTLGQLHQLLAVDDIVNMDARTVLACLPFAGKNLIPAFSPGDSFRSSLIRSYSEQSGTLHPTSQILNWLTDVRTREEVHTTTVPLRGLPGWYRDDDVIAHESGRFFELIGVHVRAGGREVAEWSQPMIRPLETGVVAFLVAQFGGVLHALVRAMVQPGYKDVAELAPTVQCAPGNYDDLPPASRPRFLDVVTSATAEQVRYDVTLSEEGGRFYHARNRYLVVEVAPDPQFDHPDFRWMPLHQMVDLLRHSHYVNVEARSLVACLHSLSGA
ncbi:NDP-hexose 2,3-dehydratase family protein [Actinophytocola gossypii]|uniref:NDP-hexose 2,3-dehydratase family protein n=1 Tax=Actinophytocola gossypii TaxID=2812003 RepID=A0ABT2JB91_9PSEU|nr:NDP-hexose 2,3-dehydratase family protein [Actinophytocola gossypii]MCT2585137.1 NDP-hexose 2,3-dehydratase family protein [Actinophytocola gossypii]